MTKPGKTPRKPGKNKKTIGNRQNPKEDNPKLSVLIKIYTTKIFQRAIFQQNTYSVLYYFHGIINHTKVNISIDKIYVSYIRIMVRPDERVF